MQRRQPQEFGDLDTRALTADDSDRGRGPRWLCLVVDRTVKISKGKRIFYKFSSRVCTVSSLRLTSLRGIMKLFFVRGCVSSTVFGGCGLVLSSRGSSDFFDIIVHLFLGFSNRL